MRNFINAALLGVAYAAVDYTEMGRNWEGLCATGKEQSPIDLTNQSMENKLSIAAVGYKNFEGTAKLKDLGKTLQVDMADPAESGTLELTFADGTKGKYNPLQFHVHAPSEHTLNGDYFDMEMHIVHQDSTGELAVLGFFFTADEDTESPFLKGLLANPPSESGTTIDKLDLKTLTENDIVGHYFSYNGSLTTPPCTEGIRWTVVEKALNMSKAQKKVFDDYYKDNEDFADGMGNNRAVQPLNDRKLVENWAGECPEDEHDHCYGGDHSHHDHDDDSATMLGAAGAALLAIAAMQI